MHSDSETPPADAAPLSETSWESLGLSESALELVRKAGYTKPTPIQAGTIPAAMDGEDIIGSAQTGTGKTASFVLPMVEKLAGREGTYGLILAPTREIAQQIQATIEIFGTPRGIRSAVLIGGVDYRYDAQALQGYPQIIVATPGRLCDHLDRGNVWLEFIEIVVLDEADRMLDMGFAAQLSRIMEEVPENRQTLLFSATISPSIDALARRILYKPRAVSIGKPRSSAGTVDDRLLWMKEENKSRQLLRIIKEEPGSIIVFTRSKDGATRVWRSLHSAGVYDATYIHSDRLQSHREQALAEFKEGKYRIMVATDVAGRGLHIDGVAHVVNYDLPFEPENYVHRIGRTGRAGSTGRATTFATLRDQRMLKQIERIMGRPIQSINPEFLSSGGDSGGGDRGPRRDEGRRDEGRREPRRGGGGGGGGRPERKRTQDRKPNNPEPVRAFPAGDAGPEETDDRGSQPGGPEGPHKRRRRRRRGKSKGPGPGGAAPTQA